MCNINTTHVKTQTNYFYIFGFYLRICHGHQEVVLGLQSCEAPQGLKIWDVEGKKSSNRFNKTIIGGGCWRLHRLVVRFFLIWVKQRKMYLLKSNSERHAPGCLRGCHPMIPWGWCTRHSQRHHHLILSLLGRVTWQITDVNECWVPTGKWLNPFWTESFHA